MYFSSAMYATNKIPKISMKSAGFGVHLKLILHQFSTRVFKKKRESAKISIDLIHNKAKYTNIHRY